MEINVSLIKGWKGIGVPPAPAVEQYFNLWHIELILRHFVYAALISTFGGDWKRALAGIKIGEVEKPLLKLLEEKSCKTEKREEFEEGYLPNLLWFTTTNQLLQIVQNGDNWKNCFEGHLGVSKKDFVGAVKPLTNQRNRWAHFRPLASDQEKLRDIIAFLQKPLRRWTARYWNSDPIVKGYDDIVAKYTAEVPGGIPLATEWPHGTIGFIDKSLPIDRGWKILLQENEAGTCYWVKLLNVGVATIWSWNLVIKCATRLSEYAIHVAVNYDPFASGEPATDKGISDISISFSKKEGIERLIRILSTVSSLILDQKMLRSRKYSDQVELTPTEMTRVLFYEAPWNVIVAPTQEDMKSFFIRGPQ